MTQDQATQIVSKYEPLVVLATYNILFTNDIVCANVIDSIEGLKRTSLYRQRIKQLARKADDARKDYEKLVNKIISDRCTFFADANDVFSEEINKHIQILYYCIKREFDRHKIGQSDIIAKLETARTLCDFSCQQFDKRLEELREKDHRFRRFHLDYLRLTNLLRLMNELIQSFRLPCTVYLNTPECLTAIDVLAQKLVNGDLIAKAISA